MHAADFAAARLRELREKIEEAEAGMLAGYPPDYTTYRQAVARRSALLEAADLIRDALNRDEAR